MVVEPDVLVRMTVSDYLRECGYRVVEAITGEEALSILGAGVKVDTILSAIKLQGALDGFALAQRIREGFSGVEVVLTTGIAMTAKKAGELCGQSRGKRPYHPDLIIDRLKLLFERHRPKPG
jgi:CheY-like chemotaxis protein